MSHSVHSPGVTKRYLTPYLNDSREDQLWESNAVGLTMKILKNQVIELVNESILGRECRNRYQRGTSLGNESLTYGM